MASQRELLDNGLPKINCIITTNNDKAQAIFSSRVPQELPWQPIPDGANFSLVYATDEIPVQLSDDKDLTTYMRYLDNKPGIIIHGGTVCRYVDISPGMTSPMHRTVSLDYGVVIEGDVELILDSGETKLLHRGDVVIQRGTNHAWRNVNQDSWARMLYVLQEAQPLVINGETLGEDYGGITGVKPSKGH